MFNFSTHSPLEALAPLPNPHPLMPLGLLKPHPLPKPHPLQALALPKPRLLQTLAPLKPHPLEELFILNPHPPEELVILNPYQLILVALLQEVSSTRVLCEVKDILIVIAVTFVYM